MSTTRSIRRTASVGVAGALSVLALAVVPAQSAPATLPSEGRIAFSSNRAGNYEIYSMASDGSDVRRLTNDTEWDTHPAWSADGKKIAFVRGTTGLWVMAADGGSPSEIDLPGTVSLVGNPSWSPLGEQLAFGCEIDGGSEICIVGLDGNGFEQLTDDDVFDDGPAWSPDGTKIAFQRGFGSSAGAGVHVMDVDDTNVVVRLADGSQPAWSPDGTKIAFTRDSEIWVMNADGSGQPSQLTDNGDVDAQASWSPEGTKIAFTSDRDGSSSREVYIMNADGSSETKLTDNEGIVDFWPAFSPDLTAPSLSITSPADGALLTAQTFDVKGTASDGASGVATIEVKVGDGAFATATGTTSWSRSVTTEQGPHTITVRATDKAGNARQASIQVHVDSEAPETTIVSAKDHQGKQIKRNGKTAATSITFALAAADNFPEVGGGVALECRLDGQAFAPCASTVAYTLLTKGTHTFEARAVDGSDNVDPTPATFTWTVTTKAVK